MTSTSSLGGLRRRFGTNLWVNRWCHAPELRRADPSWEKENLFVLLVFHLHPLCSEWALSVRREAQSSPMSCEKHRANPKPQNQAPQTPSLPLLLRGTEGRGNNKRKYYCSCSLEMDKPTTPLQGQLEPSQRSPPHFLPEIPPGDIPMDTAPQMMCYQRHPCLFASPSSKRDHSLSKSIPQVFQEQDDPSTTIPCYLPGFPSWRSGELWGT